MDRRDAIAPPLLEDGLTERPASFCRGEQMVAISKDQIIKQAKAGIREVSVDEAKNALAARPNTLLLDVREGDEVSAGKVKNAVHIPRGFLELKIEGLEK